MGQIQIAKTKKRDGTLGGRRLDLESQSEGVTVRVSLAVSVEKYVVCACGDDNSRCL